MPLYGDKLELEKLAKRNRCAVCNERVTVFSDFSAGLGKPPKFFIACNDWTRTKHEGITRHDKEGEKNMAKLKESLHMDSKALTKLTEPQMLQRVSMAKFPQTLTPADKNLLAKVAVTYGFDPLMGEVTIYQGRPFVSIDGRYRMAQETGKLDGVNTRPATKQEREDWQIPDGDYFFRSEVFVKGSSHPFIGWGRVHAKETKGSEFLPLVKDPQRMAEKRAEAQGLRKAFHIPLPSAEDIGSPDENATRIVDVKVEENKQNIPGGTAIDGEYKESPEPVTEQKAPEQEEKTYKRDPATIQHAGGLTEACKVDFGYKFQADMLKRLTELAGKQVTLNDLNEPGKCAAAYRLIADNQK